jgi:hypothetical protein
VLIATALAAVAAIIWRLPAVFFFVLPGNLALAWVFRAPVVGFYGVFAASLLIPVQPQALSDSITDLVPFFANLSDGALGITPAEILIGITFIGLLAMDRTRVASQPAGPLVRPYVLFGLVVLIGELNGLTHGGNFKLSLWELRPQAYGIAMFALGTLLIRNRGQLKVLLAILLVAETYKGALGIFRYYVTLDRQVLGAVAIQPHEESYLLGLFVVVVVLGLIWYRKPLTFFLAFVSPIIIASIVINHRRAATGALGLEIVAVFVLAYLAEPRYRKQLMAVGTVLMIAGVAFLAAFWNQKYGFAGELVRPIRSIFDPSSRDLSSDMYRIAESANLKATFRLSPIFGIGFGHPYYIFYPQSGVADYDPLWNIIPHNTVLWIPMRMGILGVISFWGLISAAIVEAIWAVRNIQDKFVRGAVIFCISATLGELFYGYYDVGLENYRNLIVLGVLLAVINRAQFIAEDPPKPARQKGAIVEMVKPAIPHQLES